MGRRPAWRDALRSRCRRGRIAWLLVGECGGEPRLLDAKGTAVALDLKSGTAESPAAGKALLLPQDGDHAVMLKLTAAPDGTVWRVQKGGAGWRRWCACSPAAADGKPTVDLQRLGAVPQRAGVDQGVVLVR